MTPKEREAMQQALLYLEAFAAGETVKPYESEEAITALREALAKPCVNGCDTSNGRCVDCPDSVSEQAEQEPVAWGRIFDGDIIDCICPEEHALNEGDYTVPLYAAPVRTKDLTDWEILKTNKTELPDCQDLVDFARAVIAADREKNNPLTKSNKGE